MILDVMERLQSIHESIGLTAPRGAVQTVPSPLPAAIVLPAGATTGWGAAASGISGGLRRITRSFIVWLIVAPATDDESHFEETANLLDTIITAYPPVTQEWAAIEIYDDGVSAKVRLYDLTNQPYWGARLTLEITQKF